MNDYILFNDGTYDNQEIIKVNFTREELSSLVRGETSLNELLLPNEKNYYAYSSSSTYQFKLDDLIKACQEFVSRDITLGEFYSYINLFKAKRKYPINDFLIPNNYNSYDYNDLYFAHDDNLLVASIEYLYQKINRESDLIYLQKIIFIIEDIKKNRELKIKSYQDDTLIFLLENMSYCLINRKEVFADKDKKFFKEKIQYLNEKGSSYSYEILARQYQYGSSIYKKDLYFALEYYLLAFEINKSPHIAKKIGKIYYESKDHSELSFSYLIYSYLHLKEYDGIMALAGCYIFGKGTFINLETAKGLLEDAFHDLNNYAIAGNYNPYLAPISFNLAFLLLQMDDKSYQNEIINCLECSSLCYQLNDYLNLKNKNLKIQEKIFVLLKDNYYPQARTIKLNGYHLEHLNLNEEVYALDQCYLKDGYLHLAISSTFHKPFGVVINELNYHTLVSQLHLIFNCDVDDAYFYKYLDGKFSYVRINGNNILFCVNDYENDDHAYLNLKNLLIPFSEVVLTSEHIQRSNYVALLENSSLYILLDEFDENNKEIYYLSNNKMQKGKVVAYYQCYDDEIDFLIKHHHFCSYASEKVKQKTF
jgi:hypothetical protein